MTKTVPTPNESDSNCDDDTKSISSDDALCELLGISSIGQLRCDDDYDDDESKSCPNRCATVDDLVRVDDYFITETIKNYKTKNNVATKQTMNFFLFPDKLSIPANIMRRLTDELVWGGDRYKSLQRTFEPIYYLKDGIKEERHVLTRLENLNEHLGWYQLCNNYIQRCVSIHLGQDMVLYKSKLNLKPVGGSGFAPHVDAPSLKIPFGLTGPQNFITVMVAIDDMTIANGCLRVANGDWDNEDSCPTIPPETAANPDAGGRAGAIPTYAADRMNFIDVCCKAGTMCAFGGWVPHRSGVNQSNFPRRAVFLTYNPASEGNYCERYYTQMEKLRMDWKTSNSSLTPHKSQYGYPIDAIELNALSTIPRI